MIKRPSKKELTKKISLAKQHLQNDNWQALSYDTFMEDCIELGLCTQIEISQALL